MTIEELNAVKENRCLYEYDHVFYDRNKLERVKGNIKIATSLIDVFAKHGHLEGAFEPAYLRVIDTMIDANISEDKILSSLSDAFLLADTLPKELLTLETLEARQATSSQGRKKNHLVSTLCCFQLFVIHLKQLGLSDDLLKGCLGEHLTKGVKR